MNKYIFLAVFLFAAASAVFAVDFGISVGGGALLGGNFTKSETDPTNMSIQIPRSLWGFGKKRHGF
jgi:hypothetical protein